MIFVATPRDRKPLGKIRRDGIMLILVLVKYDGCEVDQSSSEHAPLTGFRAGIT